jgi:hypothetical protein
MHIEGVAIIPRCAECEAHWLPADETRWEAWLTDDEPPELVFYCPGCAESSSVTTNMLPDRQSNGRRSVD